MDPTKLAPWLLPLVSDLEVGLVQRLPWEGGSLDHCLCLLCGYIEQGFHALCVPLIHILCGQGHVHYDEKITLLSSLFVYLISHTHYYT